MVRLTADLIWRSPQYFNPVKEREIDLRGNKIAVVENLGATEDHFDSIDISDNEIVKLEGFPLMKRLRTLMASNNRITRVSTNLGALLPNLTTLVLTSNRLVNLTDLNSLVSLSNLEYLSLVDNLVTKQPGYRLYVIHKLPKLRLLDFKKVKQKEKDEARRIYGELKAAEALAAAEVKKPAVLTFEPGQVEGEAMEEAEKGPEEPTKKGPTPEQLTALKAAIANAQTLEEVARLEKALESGQMPSEIKSLDAPVPAVAAPLAAKVANGGGTADGAAAMEEG